MGLKRSHTVRKDNSAEGWPLVSPIKNAAAALPAAPAR
jgi:hypothetical protein